MSAGTLLLPFWKRNGTEPMAESTSNRRSNELVVVLAADHNFAPQLATTLSSLSMHHTTGRCQAVILHDGYSRDERQRVSVSAFGGVSIDWIDLGDFTPHRGMMDGRLPAATFYRLKMGEVLAQSVDKVIYLDTDLLVRKPLDELWNTDASSHAIAAARDAKTIWVSAPGGLPWQDLGISPDRPYFNAGVLVVSLDRWRSERIGDRVLEVMGKTRIKENDQGGLNAVLAGSWQRLEPRWNLQSAHLDGTGYAWGIEPERELREACEEPAIVHFSGFDKPWSSACSHPFRGLWFDALEQTAWAGWKPPRATLSGAVFRFKRAFRAVAGR